MKKKYIRIISIILIIFFVPTQIGKSQVLDGLGAANTDTAANTTIMVTQLTSLGVLIENMKRAGDVVKDALKTVEAYNKIKDAVHLAQLIESTICGMEEYHLYLEIAIQHNSCIASFDYELINTKFAYSTNLISIASQAESLFNSESRVNSIKDAIAALEGNMKKIEEHNKIVHSQIEADVMTAYNQHLVKSLYEIKM